MGRGHTQPRVGRIAGPFDSIALDACVDSFFVSERISYDYFLLDALRTGLFDRAN